MKPPQRIDSELCQRAGTSLGYFREPKLIFDRVQGCYVWDSFGNKYIDFTEGMGRHVLGYGHAELSETIGNHARMGFNLGQTSKLEIQCAERLKELLPWAEKVMFFESACDAQIALKYIECETINSWSDRLLLYSKEWAEKNQLWFMDEENSFFRVPEFSLSKQLGLRPSLTLLGNFSGGIPLYAIAGRSDLMEEYFDLYPKSHNTLAFGAALKMIDLLSSKYSLSHLEAQARDFQTRFNKISKDLQLMGQGTYAHFVCNDYDFANRFYSECLKSGILVSQIFYFSFPHIDVKDDVLSIFSDIITKIRSEGDS